MVETEGIVTTGYEEWPIGGAATLAVLRGIERQRLEVVPAEAP